MTQRAPPRPDGHGGLPPRPPHFLRKRTSPAHARGAHRSSEDVVGGVRGPASGAAGVNVVAPTPAVINHGARIEDHAGPVAVVARAFRATARRYGVPRRRSGREGGARALKPPDERERGLEVVSVEDRLVDSRGADRRSRRPRGCARRLRHRQARTGPRPAGWLYRVSSAASIAVPIRCARVAARRAALGALGSKGGGDVGERGGRIGEDIVRAA